MGGTNNAVVYLYNSFFDVVAWDGNFVHIRRLPAHPVDTGDSSSLNKAYSRPATFLGATPAVGSLLKVTTQTDLRTDREEGKFP
jgi:hypothetical protein